MAGAPAAAEPALWAIKGPQSTIYLFGTVHALPPSLDWKTPKIEAAFSSSGELWEEIDWDEDPLAARALLIDLGMDKAHTLSSQLDPADRQALARATEPLGGSAAVEQLRPWAAAMVVSSLPVLHRDYEARSGAGHGAAPRSLRCRNCHRPVRDARTAAPIHGGHAGGGPDRLSPRYHQESARAAAQLDKLVDAWSKGDVDFIAKSTDEMRIHAPVLYQRLVLERNARWANILVGQLRRRGTQFVAVGAAHLAGPDSVLALLAKQGIVAERQ